MYVTTRMDLEHMLEEASHKKPHTVWFHFYETSRRGKSKEKEGVKSGCLGPWGRGGRLRE